MNKFIVTDKEIEAASKVLLGKCPAGHKQGGIRDALIRNVKIALEAAAKVRTENE